MTDKAASVGAGGKKPMQVNELVEIIRKHNFNLCDYNCKY